MNIYRAWCKTVETFYVKWGSKIDLHQAPEFDNNISVQLEFFWNDWRNEATSY